MKPKLTLKSRITKPILKAGFAFCILLCLLGVIRLCSFYGKINQDDIEYQNSFRNKYKIYAVNIPNDLNFAGEQVPLQDIEVRERIDREFLVNTYFQSQTVLMAKRANRWFPIISEILKKNNIPDDFKYLALIESGFTLNVSPKGAAGFWQFMPATATSYGLIINEDVDERYNVVKSTEAACKYFKEAYTQFKNWTLVAASFNMGQAGIQKQINQQKAKSYYDLLLNDETARYVFRILAVKEIISRPYLYGFVLRKKDLYPPLPGSYVTVDSTITNLPNYAQEKGTTYKMLKFYNPWLKGEKLSNPNKIAYKLFLPSVSALQYDQLVKEAETTQVDVLQLNDSIPVKNP